MGKTKEDRTNARQRAYLTNPTKPLTHADYSRIRFTHRMIHPIRNTRETATLPRLRE